MLVKVVRQIFESIMIFIKKTAIVLFLKNNRFQSPLVICKTILVVIVFIRNKINLYLYTYAVQELTLLVLKNVPHQLSEISLLQIFRCISTIVLFVFELTIWKCGFFFCCNNRCMFFVCRLINKSSYKYCISKLYLQISEIKTQKKKKRQIMSSS